jgi:predicted Zn finger-like uncharacterized protein
VVVVCEKCETRFHLDDSRVPAQGARVRCSRCQHEFSIAPPGSAKPDPLDEVVAEVTGASGAPVALDAEDRSPGDFEEVWEFNDDSPTEVQAQAKSEDSGIDAFDVTAPDLGGKPPEPEIGWGGAGSLDETDPEIPLFEEPPSDPVESIRARDAELGLPSADDLGRPEDWDFVGTGEIERPSDLIAEDEAREGAPARAEESASDSPAPVEADSAATRPLAAEESDRASLAGRLAGLASIGGWVAVALAFSMVISALLGEPGEGSGARAGWNEMQVSGVDLTASEVESRWVENALAGNLLVVSGKLENRGPEAVTPGRAILVQLVSASGLPIDEAISPAGRTLTATRLREWDPDRLRRELDDSAAEMARRSFRPGAHARFEAVFESIPASAAGWVLRTATSSPDPDPGISLPSAAPLAWE